MSVATRFYRLPDDAIRKLEAQPELMDLLLGCSEKIAHCEKNCFCSAPNLDIDAAWDEILILLCRTDHLAACRALDISLWDGFDGFEEVRLFSPAQIRAGFEILKNLEAEKIRAAALRRGLRASGGEPIDLLLDDALGHLQSLIDFWREAAAAGEGIVSSTG